MWIRKCCTKMKYLLYPKESENMKWSFIYCNKNGKETGEDIVKAIVFQTYVGKFIATEHEPLGNLIKNDESLYITRNAYGILNIWQVGSKLEDMTGTIIPHTYKVRNIGMLSEW